jgi:hypothetical protein
MLVVTTWYLKITTRIYNMMGTMLVVTTWTSYLKITTRHLQHDGRHVGSYHMDIIPEDYYATFTTRWVPCW